MNDAHIDSMMQAALNSLKRSLEVTRKEIKSTITAAFKTLGRLSKMGTENRAELITSCEEKIWTVFLPEIPTAGRQVHDT